MTSPQHPRRPFGVRAPGALRLALGALLVEAAALVAGGGVLAWGGLAHGVLPDMLALGVFFLLLGLGVGACALALERGRGRVRGLVLTVQLLLGAAVVSLRDLFPSAFVLLTVVLAIVTVAGVLAPTSRAYLAR